MKITTKKALISFFIILFVLILDQGIKFWVKTHMYLNEMHYLFPKIHWLRIIFVENEGMAFGIRLPGNSGKIILTSLRIIIALFVLVYIIKLIRKPQTKIGLIIVMSLIFAGAVGNIIDSIFYGVIFSESPPITAKSFLPPAQFMPPGGGYSSFFYGKVVDMIQFPIFLIHLPDWFPIWGGKSFYFFDPVYNIADASIFIGVVILIIFGQKLFKPAYYAKN